MTPRFCGIDHTDCGGSPGTHGSRQLVPGVRGPGRISMIRVACHLLQAGTADILWPDRGGQPAVTTPGSPDADEIRPDTNDIFEASV